MLCLVCVILRRVLIADDNNDFHVVLLHESELELEFHKQRKRTYIRGQCHFLLKKLKWRIEEKNWNLCEVSVFYFFFLSCSFVVILVFSLSHTYG